MKFTLLLPFFLLLTISLSARTLEVRTGGTYVNLEQAAAVAMPGDTILFRNGVYAGNQGVEGLQGTPSSWITIMAAEGEEVILRGGGNAWQLSDPAYLRIAGFVLEGQTGNGLNIDDGGSFDTPAHHIVIERCEWRGIDATGNNDQLKMSGVDSFEVRDCVFRDGATGGSMIDMVGCHDGSFVRNRFERAGSNCIQAKGGTREIRIERNTFLEGGSRAINIGGSTGLQFFRPLGTTYEAANIRVYSNIFSGSDAPVAFVGAVNCEVVNNTIWLPRRWAIRILQETTESEFVQCGDNTFRNNIVVVDNSVNPTINIGSNTRPMTFTFSNNLWFNIDNPSWSGPNLPTVESDGIIGRDPMLAAPPGDMSLQSGSPAIAAGYSVDDPKVDYSGKPYATPRSIGAIEGGGTTTSVESDGAAGGSLSIMMIPGGSSALATFTLSGIGTIEASVYDLQGKLRWIHGEQREGGRGRVRIPLETLESGAYICTIRSGSESLAQTIVVRR